MDFGKMVTELMKAGYKRAGARAKIAHDVVLAAIKASGMKDHVTIKGGVVMSGMTQAARRATIDMDADFVSYSLSNVAIEKFVRGLDAHSDCSIAIEGPIADLRQQEYKGKRFYLRVTDENGYKVLTKLDLGMHTKVEVAQKEFKFDIITDRRGVRLLANSKEQMFAEKLKSLLRLGTLSTRYKDVYDMYYLSDKINRTVLKNYFGLYIYQDRKMRERTPDAIVGRLRAVFNDALFRRQLRNKKFAWIDVPSNVVTQRIIDFIRSVR